MKKTSKACFVVGIVVLAVSVCLIAASFFTVTVHHQRSLGFYYFQYTSINPIPGMKMLALGCTGIISGLLLFLLSVELRQLPPSEFGCSDKGKGKAVKAAGNDGAKDDCCQQEAHRSTTSGTTADSAAPAENGAGNDEAPPQASDGGAQPQAGNSEAQE